VGNHIEKKKDGHALEKGKKIPMTIGKKGALRMQ